MKLKRERKSVRRRRQKKDQSQGEGGEVKELIFWSVRRIGERKVFVPSFVLLAFTSFTLHFVVVVMAVGESIDSSGS